ncbi:MAG: DNA-binding protein, partial [Pseudomonadota bacterium]
MHRNASFGQIHPKDDKILVMPLFAYDESLKFEVFIIELYPGCEHLSPPHQKGVVEHVIVVGGELEVLVRDTWHRLKE